MIINDQKKIREIQKEFNQKFPFLKIEFYTQEHGDHEGSASKYEIDENLTIDDARTKKNEGELSINANQKVSTLEKNFHDIYGLNVQVFRKSGDVWLQTIHTDDWTLHKQNEKGEASE